MPVETYWRKKYFEDMDYLAGLAKSYQAKTIVEFINEAIERNPKEWGYFEVKSKDGGFLFCKRVEYRYGELLNEIPDEWQYREIEKIEACGGWTRMDYYIYPKQLL